MTSALKIKESGLSGRRYTSAGVQISGRQFAYNQDEIGNRITVNSSTNYTANNVNQYTAINSQNLTYDTDGNMLSDGNWAYTWDGENRLTRMVSTNLTKTLSFEYDWQGRRIAKKVWNNTTGTGTPATYLKYIYDGWNLIAELNGNSNNAKVRSYTWGLDISGSTMEAGGVGGLLFIDDNTNGVHFVSYDLNGNVMGLVKAADGTISASYEYGPFGELLVSTGTMASSNPFRFSTKYRDNETDLYYYGYRYYSPSLGRWISRDPIDEQGGLNLYAFVNNDPVNKWDLYGFSPYCVCIRAADDHAWIYVFDMEKKTKATYSRYKKKWGNPPADSSGVLKNMDLSRYYEVQRCIQVDLFTPEINEGYDWRRNNCASYVASEWKRVSGEVLNITGKRNLPENKQKESASWIYNWFDSPEIIVESIRRSNGGVKRFSTCCGGYPPKK